MTPSELSNAEKVMAVEVEKRRGLGGYSQEADAILLLCEMTLLVIRHLKGESDETGDKSPPVARRKGR